MRLRQVKIIQCAFFLFFIACIILIFIIFYLYLFCFSHLGDNTVLLKYSNPQLLLVNTLSKSSIENEEQSDSKLFVNMIDIVSGKILQRLAHENADYPVNSVVIENFAIVSYWNPKVGGCL